MGIGVAIYFAYGKKKSKLNNPQKIIFFKKDPKVIITRGPFRTSKKIISRIPRFVLPESNPCLIQKASVKYTPNHNPAVTNEINKEQANACYPHTQTISYSLEDVKPYFSKNI
jgi:hypothetical protein